MKRERYTSKQVLKHLLFTVFYSVSKPVVNTIRKPVIMVTKLFLTLSSLTVNIVLPTKTNINESLY